MALSRSQAVVFAGVFAAFTLGAGSATAQQTINLTIASSHPTTFLPVGLMAGFFKNEIDRMLKEGGKYRIVWREAYAGTLYKLTDTMEAVRDGITDIGFVGAGWEIDTMPLSNVSYFAPFVTGDFDVVMRTVDKLVREHPELRKEWERNNLQYLGGIGLETYHLWTRTPVVKFEDVRGKRYNAPGSALQWLRNTGAAGVEGGLPVYYTNLQTGVVDGVISFYTGLLPFRVHEVAPHITEVDFGAQFFGGVAINLERFRKLPKEVQDALVKAGRAYTPELVKETIARIEPAKKTMLDAGSKLVKFSDAERLRWAQTLPDIAGEWAKASGPAGREVLTAFMTEARKAGAKPLRDWDK